MIRLYDFLKPYSGDGGVGWEGFKAFISLISKNGTDSKWPGGLSVEDAVYLIQDKEWYLAYRRHPDGKEPFITLVIPHTIIRKIAITSMYANPIHIGHIDILKLSKELADQVWVIVNNDKQAFLKRGTPSFQDEECRLAVVASVRYVDRAILSIDQDPTVCKTLESLILEAQSQELEVIFTKGADRRLDAGNIPEKEVCDKYGVKIVDGLGEKIRSSSDFLKPLLNQVKAETDLNKLKTEVEKWIG